MDDHLIKRQLLSGTFYTALAKYSSIIVSIGVTAVLSRILSPEDFGVVAIVTIFINFFSLISTMGISPAIIQNKTLTVKDIQSLYSLTFYIGLIFGLLFIAFSPIIVSFYENPILLNICALLSINIFFSVVVIVPNSLFLKEKNFKFVAIRTICVQIIIGVCAIIYALNGGGIYALLVNPILGSIIVYIITIKKKKIIFSFSFELASVRKILSFSVFQMLFNVVNLIYRNIDKLLVGKYFSLSELGYYEKSYRLMMLPLENISNVVNPVLHPVLSDYQNDNEFIYQKYRRVVTIFAWIGFPLSVYLHFSAKEIVLILFGDQWMNAVPVFQILSFSVGIQLVQSAVGAIFQALNKTKCMFYASIWAMIAVLTGVFIGLNSGLITNLAWNIVVAFFVSFFIYHYFLVKRTLNQSFVKFLYLLLKPLMFSIVVCFMFFTLDAFWKIDNIFLLFILKSVSFVIIMIPVIWFTDLNFILRFNKLI